MNRIIDFRGFSITDKKWVYGSLNLYLTHSPMITSLVFPQSWLVAPGSIGQYTGRPDNKGDKIYEGDLIRQRLEDSVEPEGFFFCESIVEMVQGCWVLSQIGFDYSRTPLHERSFLYEADDIEVIGNIHGKEVANG